MIRHPLSALRARAISGILLLAVGAGMAASAQEAKKSVVDGVTLTRHTVQIAPRFYVPYNGTDAGIRQRFPQGFPIAPGSGLTLRNRDADGSLWFYALTDRGPNGDSPDLGRGSRGPDGADKTKAFPAPDYVPKFGLIRVRKGVAELVSVTDIKTAEGVNVSGRPVQAGIGSSGETPLTEALQATLGFDPNGIDPEAIARDPDGKHVWICDEYGPYLIKVAVDSGRIVAKFAPASGLPEVIQFRQPNRGCEGLAITPGGKLVMAIQSILEMPDIGSGPSARHTGKAPFTRLVEFNPANGATRMFAYPHDLARYGKSKDAKIGDIVALSDTRFVLIEQGKFKADGEVHNLLVAVDVAGATDLTGKKLADGLELEYAGDLGELSAAGVAAAKRLEILDLRKKDAGGKLLYGWLPEKAEGLALVNDDTLALINDNDFGVSARIVDAAGKAIKVDDCKVDAAGVLGGKKCKGAAPLRYEIINGSDDEKPTRLWLIRLPKKLMDYRPG
ncbi:esterase-like activity of phytase family protein [Polaromonas sp. YR568]|uniref:esterase-like activity of phytase family protein n=1 Tax=Polaromonas sp. YR568 TaxID=1855301 RepID=UPI001587C052|nr:esterase-like activity of phytase family protein [Polaromonas sp. YR568]